MPTSTTGMYCKIQVHTSTELLDDDHDDDDDDLPGKGTLRLQIQISHRRGPHSAVGGSRGIVYLLYILAL